MRSGSANHSRPRKGKLVQTHDKDHFSDSRTHTGGWHVVGGPGHCSGAGNEQQHVRHNDDSETACEEAQESRDDHSGCFKHLDLCPGSRSGRSGEEVTR